MRHATLGGRHGMRSDIHGGDPGNGRDVRGAIRDGNKGRGDVRGAIRDGDGGRRDMRGVIAHGKV